MQALLCVLLTIVGTSVSINGSLPLLYRTINDFELFFCSLLPSNAGIGNSAVYAPLGADMTTAIDSITEAKPHLFTTGAAQALSSFDSAIALGRIFGPVWAGFTYEVGNWWIMSLTLAIIGASGALPVVNGLLISHYVLHTSGLTGRICALMCDLAADVVYRENKISGMKI